MNKEYEDYRKTEAWAIRRRACLDRFDGLCAMCGNRAWIAHHRTYDRFKNESIKDLTALCGTCHELFHGIVVDELENKYPTMLKMKCGQSIVTFNLSGKVKLSKIREVFNRAEFNGAEIVEVK